MVTQKIINEIKELNLKQDYEIYFYLKNKGLVNINIIEVIKEIQGVLKWNKY